MGGIWKRAGALALALLCACAAVPPALAEEAFDAIGFTVHAVLPDNQREATGYFDLWVTPGRSQLLWVEVVNHIGKEIVVSVEVNNAASNQNGLIVYSGGTERDESLLLGLTDMAIFRDDLLDIGPDRAVLAVEGNLVTIAPYATVQIPVEITVPAEAFAGEVLGGIVVSRMDYADDALTGLEIRSVYSYAIAVQLQEKDRADVPYAFMLLSAAPTTVAGWRAVTVSLRNPVPRVASGGQLHIAVYEEDEQEPLWEHENPRVSMAPNSVMPYTVVLTEGEYLEPGTYIVRVTWAFAGEIWSWDEPLVIAE